MTAVFEPLTEQRTGPGRRKTDMRVTPDLIVDMVIAELHPLLEHPDQIVRQQVSSAMHAVGRLIR